MADLDNANEWATDETTRLAPIRVGFRPLIDFDPPRAIEEQMRPIEEELFSRWFTANFDLTRTIEIKPIVMYPTRMRYVPTEQATTRRTDYVTALNEIDE